MEQPPVIYASGVTLASVRAAAKPSGGSSRKGSEHVPLGKGKNCVSATDSSARAAPAMLVARFGVEALASPPS